MAKRDTEFYPTPGWATRELLKRSLIGGIVCEPCAGDLAIAAELADNDSIDRIVCNDLDHRFTDNIMSHEDATDPAFWASLGRVDYVVTNPPFSKAHVIVPLAKRTATRGVYMLLRLTYLEPCEGRAGWLAANPPNVLLVLPRISFTGDGKTDSATCAWMGWDKYVCGQRIEIVPDPSDLPGALFLSEAGYGHGV